MGTGYTRNDTANNIADGNIINASDLDGEFDAVQSAFNASTGHTHDGTAGEGAPIETIGPSQDVVATASVLRPKTDNTVDLGTTSLEYKDLFLDGTAHIDTLDVDENASITGTLGVTGTTTLGTANITTGTITTADINGGNIDGTIIGATTAAAITGTTITGTSFVTSGDMTFGDNDKAVFGAGSDLQIYHDGSHSYVDENGTGQLKIRSNGTGVLLQTVSGENLATFANNAAVNLYYDNAAKLATTSTGIDVTGTVTADGLTVDGNNDIQINRDGVSSAKIFWNRSVTQDAAIELNASENLTISVDDAGLTGKSLILKNNSKTGFALSDGGDISFYEDTGTTPKFFWDASAESLGIGTSTSLTNGTLNVLSNGTSVLQARADTAGVSDGDTTVVVSRALNSTAGKWANAVYRGYSHAWSYGSGASSNEAMRIDSSGNVGIGTSSPSPTGVGIDIDGDQTSLRLSDSAKSTYAEVFANNGTMILKADANNAFANSLMTFQVDGSERMRIDSSGHLLVGTTDAGIYDDATDEAGHNLLANGQYYNSAVSEINMILNKQNSDGDIVQFRKDGAPVGSIGTSGGRVYFADDSTNGITFSNSSAIMWPSNSSGGVVDNTLDIGSSSYRFKDLYLSGGVYLGGTGAANKLDDYEEGTWTPVLTYQTAGTLSVSYSTQMGRYTKVGNMVTIHWAIRLTAFSRGTASGSLIITGIPFAGELDGPIGTLGLYDSSFSGIPVSKVGPSNISLLSMTSNGAWSGLADPDANAQYFGTAVYQTAS